MSCRLEPAIWSRDTGQQIPCFHRCQLISTWISNIKEVHGKARLHVSANLCIIWSMAAMLRDSTDVNVVVSVVRTRPRAIQLPMITMRKSIRGFLFPYMVMGLPLVALAAGAPLQILKKVLGKSSQLLSSEQPCEPKTLDVALIIAGVQKYDRKTCGCG